MKITRCIPADRVSDLDVQEGDTLHVNALWDSAFVVQVSHADASSPVAGKAREWLRSARGSVRLAPGESVGEVRLDYYAAKYGLGRWTMRVFPLVP